MKEALDDAVLAAMPGQIRNIFGYFLAYGVISNPRETWDLYKPHMMEDIEYAWRRQFNLTHGPFNKNQTEEVEMEALRRLDDVSVI